MVAHAPVAGAHDVWLVVAAPVSFSFRQIDFPTGGHEAAVGLVGRAGGRGLHGLAAARIE